jgi:hypothetical protein
MAQFKRFFNTWPVGWIVNNNYDVYIYLTSSSPSNTVGKLQDITLIDLTYFEKQSGGEAAFKMNTTVSSGLMTIKLGDGSPFVEGSVTVKANGGSVGPFRYVIIGYRYGSSTYYENLTPLICYFDYGTSITLTDGQEMTLSFPSNIIYTVQ